MKVIHEHAMSPAHQVLKCVGVGQPFRHPQGSDLYIRIAINNVALPMFYDHIPVVNLNNGHLYHYSAGKSVILVNAEVVVKADVVSR